jgi:hypothetical protein
MHRTVIFYQTKEGRCPLIEFLDSLDGKAAQKIIWVLNLLGDMDNIPSLYFKKLTGSDGIWECRINTVLIFTEYFALCWTIHV